MGGINFGNRNRPLVTTRVTVDTYMSMGFNNVSTLWHTNAGNLKCRIPLNMPPGFNTYLVQEQAGSITLTPDAGVTILGTTLGTTTAGDILKLICVKDNTFAVMVSGSSAAPPPPAGASLIKVVSAAFTNASDYDNVALLGNGLGIFLNQINRYLEDAEWQFTATGIRILLPGFDSTVQNVTFYIGILSAP